MPIDWSSWSLVLTQPLQERPGFNKEADEVEYSQVTARVLGASYDETEYLLSLYSIAQQPNVYILSEILDKQMPSDRFQSVQRIYSIVQNEPNLSVNRFVAFLEGEQLLPKYKEDPDFNRLIRSALIDVFSVFQQNHSGAFKHPEFRRVFLDIIKWTWNHLNPWINESDFSVNAPHVVWYGDMNKSQMYFLLYLILLGIDVLILHPEGTDDFKEIDPDHKWTIVSQYPSEMKWQPFPIEKPKRQGTVAYRASKEIDQVLHHEGSALYKPWQFRHHLPVSVTLKTTYDEVFLIAKEKACIRPNFAADTEHVKIPVSFSKISGVSNDRKDYWDKMNQLIEWPNSFTINHFPYMKDMKANYQFHYQHALGTDGNLDVEKMIESNWWQYHHLHDGLQKSIATAIARMCAKPKLQSVAGEDIEQVRLYLFKQATALPEEILVLLQKFDYSQDVPKIVLYNNEKNGTLSKADAALLTFLNEFGLDIILYNPPGHNDLEKFIESKYFDHHFLDEMVFDLPFNEREKELSILSRFFKKIF
ncbi:hypothetical protein CD798_11500 [Bacillaceae bacterium SAOS 7]|nr:hypothetical protein CD798_11500 [Bacillaceae bacterium SAOS 7]